MANKQSFVNPCNFIVPPEGTLAERVEKAKRLFLERRAIEKEMREYRDKIEYKLRDYEDVISIILVFNVAIKHCVDSHLFTVLAEAEDFKKRLCAAGIKEEDVTIELTDRWGDLENIDMHRRPEKYGYLYDIDIKVREYKCLQKQKEDRKMYDSAHWMN